MRDRSVRGQDAEGRRSRHNPAVMRVAQPSGTVTLVFTDIEGSTRLLEQLGTEAYREALAEHRRIVREACARHQGYEVDYEGDAFFYAFATAQAAVTAIGEAMQGLQGGPIRIRVGIHTGEPALDPPKYVGLDIHHAARIMSAAHGGQVVLSRRAVDLLDDGIELRDLGNHRFKDFDRPERIYQLGCDHHPPLKTLYRSSLPVPATPFLGRDAEVAEIVERLLHADTRLLTLTGPGGTGKTRLAIRAAGAAADHFPDGTTWVALAPLRDPALIHSTISSALELAEHAGSPLDAITRALAGRHTLLLIDNLEHLLPQGAEALAGLLAACPDLRVLATSRERLAVRAEREYPVDSLLHDDAVALLLARADALSVPLTHDPSVDALVERLDRLPLAIELAAPRLKLLGASDLLQRVGERLDHLRGGRDADPRQQTLRATIAWSHDLLTPDEQRLFRHLAIFQGGATVAAVEAICGTDIETIQSLLDKSLLRRRTDGSEPRLWMLETIRAFALEQLEAAPDEHGAVRAKHLAWFCRMARPANGYPWTASPERVDALERSLHDLRFIHDQLVEREETTEALRLAVDLFPLWEVRDRHAEGDRWLERALALPGSERSAERGVALDARSSTANLLGRPDDCRRYATAAVEILRVSGTQAQLAMAMQGQAESLYAVDAAAALALAESSLALARESGDPWTTRTILLNIGAYAARNGEHEKAEGALRDALLLSRQLGDDYFVAACLESLGHLHLDLGRLEEAWALYLEAADHALTREGRLTLGLSVGGLAACAARLHEYDTARALWSAFETWESERAVRLHTMLRDRFEAAIALVDAAEPGEEQRDPLTLEEAVERAHALTR